MDQVIEADVKKVIWGQVCWLLDENDQVWRRTTGEKDASTVCLMEVSRLWGWSTLGSPE